jgi:transposase-like protein
LLLEPRLRAEHAWLAMVQQVYVEGVSTGKLNDLVQALGLSWIDESPVSRICHVLHRVMWQFRERTLAECTQASGWMRCT